MKYRLAQVFAFTTHSYVHINLLVFRIFFEVIQPINTRYHHRLLDCPLVDDTKFNDSRVQSTTAIDFR